MTRAPNNKGKRDGRVLLHSVVVEHLRQLQGFSLEMFPWPPGQRAIWDEFHRIQRAAGIHLFCNEKHTHTDACHVYGFHDLHRAFATHDAGSLSATELQAMMRHQHFSTTRRYINMAHQLMGTVDRLMVPPALRRKQR